MWPGFGENARVLKWIVERVNGLAQAKETPLGWMPSYDDLDWDGLDFTKDDWDELMKVDGEALKSQALSHEELFLKLWDHMPKELLWQRDLLLSRY